MKKNCENSHRKHVFKRQSSQETKRFKQKKTQSISPIQKQITLHQNKQNAHPNINHKPQSIYEKHKHQYFELKNSAINKELAKCKNYVPSAYIQPTQKPKEINILMSKSLEKCQLYHEKETPKSSYLIMNKNDQILCCDQCSRKYPHKTNIRKITEKQIVGKKLSEYFKQLHENLNMMELLKENTVKYREKYREYAYKEERKHQKYYHQILEVIEENMKASQTILRKKINQVDKVFDDKIQIFDEEIHKIHRMMNQLTNVNDQFYEFKQLNRLSSMNKDDFSLCLPFLSLSINESLLQEFKVSFDTKYSIKIITEKQVPKEEKPSEKVKKDFSEDYHQKNGSGNYRNEYPSRSKSYQIPNSYNSYEDTQLYCDEALGSISSVNNFSFEGEQDNIVPIIELTEEEEVISPNFKIF